jgi:hypothetical protein
VGVFITEKLAKDYGIEEATGLDTGTKCWHTYETGGHIMFHLSANFSLITREDTDDPTIASAMEAANDALALAGRDEDTAAYLSGVLAVAGSGLSDLNERLLDEAESHVEDIINQAIDAHLSEYTVTQINWRLDAIDDNPMDLI